MDGVEENLDELLESVRSKREKVKSGNLAFMGQQNIEDTLLYLQEQILMLAQGIDNINEAISMINKSMSLMMGEDPDRLRLIVDNTKEDK